MNDQVDSVAGSVLLLDEVCEYYYKIIRNSFHTGAWEYYQVRSESILSIIGGRRIRESVQRYEMSTTNYIYNLFQESWFPAMQQTIA